MKKITGLVLSACLVFVSIPALAQNESSESSVNLTSNMKKMSKNYNSSIKVPSGINNQKEKASFKVDKTKKYKQGEVLIKFKNNYSVENLEVTTNLGLSKKQDLG